MWVNYLKKPKFEGAKGNIAIAGSPGLRSIGLIAVDYLIKEWKPEKFAELYSPNFPITYNGIPYAGTTGESGVGVKEGIVELPKIEFYQKDNLILTRGYHADLFGQYEVAAKVAELYKEFKVEKIFSLGGYVPLGSKGILGEKRKVSYCATYPDAIKSGEMEKLKIEKKEPGSFLGFSALVLGIGWVKGIKGIGLFGETVPYEDEPLSPDPYAAKDLLEKFGEVLGIKIDTSKLIEKKKPSMEVGYI